MLSKNIEECVQLMMSKEEVINKNAEAYGHVEQELCHIGHGYYIFAQS